MISTPEKTVFILRLGPGAVSIQRRHLTNIGIPMLEVRRSHDRLILNSRIPIPGKDGLYIETGPRFPSRSLRISWHMECYIQLGKAQPTRNGCHRQYTDINVTMLVYIIGTFHNKWLIFQIFCIELCIPLLLHLNPYLHLLYNYHISAELFSRNIEKACIFYNFL